VAVLDWEMVSVGDPVTDLAWWLFLDRHFTQGLSVDNPPGFPARAETVARWEAAVGRPADHLEFYEVFAGLRFAIVMMRIAQLLVEAEMLPPDSDFERNNIVTTVLADMLGLAASAGG
jgi:aminoglycoside phosphotransferase (APT) family kinase protein